MATLIDPAIQGTATRTAEGPVFVLGTGRCGSTLVHEVLARHPDAIFISNAEDNFPWLPSSGRFNARVYRHLPPEWTRKGRVRFAPSEGYKVLDSQVSPIISTPPRDLLAADATPWLRDRFHAFVESRRLTEEHGVFLHKFTGWPRIGFLSAIFPTARFIHIVRDGRAVANSWLQMSWWSGYFGPQQWSYGALSAELQDEYESSGRSFVVLAAIAWKILMEAFADAAAALPASRYLEMRYEDIVDAPEGEFSRLVQFAGLEATPAFLRSVDAYQFRTDRARAFETDLSPADVATIEKSLDAMLRHYGYS